MFIKVNLKVTENNGVDMDISANLDEHILKLIDYLATKISGQKTTLKNALYEQYGEEGYDEFFFDSEAMLKWLSKLPEWAALKLKLSNPLSTKKFRKELNDKYQGLVKKYKIPDGYFIVDAEAYEEIQKRDAAKRKKVKTEK